jgi:hypothetical protein
MEKTNSPCPEDVVFRRGRGRADWRVDAVKCRDCERTVEPPNVVCDICVAKLAGDPFQDDDNELLPAPSHPVVVARVLTRSSTSTPRA